MGCFLRLAIAVAVAATSIHTNAAYSSDVPKFSGFVVEPYHGPRRGPKLGDQSEVYRDLLAAATSQDVNFAGRFVFVELPAGTGCRSGAAIDVTTGDVRLLPVAACFWKEKDKPFYFKPDSTLLVLGGHLGEGDLDGAHFFEFDGVNFKHLLTRTKDGRVIRPEPPNDYVLDLVQPEDICQARVARAQIDEGTFDPPATIIPDVGANGETNHLEWNDLQADKVDLFVKCYSEPEGLAPPISTHMLRQDTKRCAFLFSEGRMMCSTVAKAGSRVTSDLVVIEDGFDIPAAMEKLLSCYSDRIEQELDVLSISARDFAAEQSVLEANAYKAYFIAAGGYLKMGTEVRKACDAQVAKDFQAKEMPAITDFAGTFFATTIASMDRDFAEKCSTDVGDDRLRADILKACEVLQKNPVSIQ